MSKKIITLFSLFVLAVCVAARIISLVYVTESATGFFISKLSVLGVALSGAVIFLTVLATFFAFTVQITAKECFEIKKTRGVLCVLLGISIMLYCFGFGIHDSAFLWQRIFEIVSGILCGIWFIAVGVNVFHNVKIPVISSIVPCIHWIFRLVVVFGTFSSNALVAEHIFSLSALCVTCVFMLEFGKNRACIQSKKGRKFLYPMAICGAVLNLSSALPRIIVAMIGHIDKIHGEAPIDIVSIAVGIFMLFITADINNEKKIGEKENEV